MCDIATQSEFAPAVLTVFRIDSIMRLSPDACSRTLVRSRGLSHTNLDVSVFQL